MLPKYFAKNARRLAWLILVASFLQVAIAPAATPMEIHAFPGPDFFPNGLAQGTNGNF
ncbi:MAG: hypothetical protein ACREE6_12905 [Limisphaerales bacterium]